MINAVVFDVYGTLLRIGERRHPFRQLMKVLRSQGRQPQTDDARILMTNDVGITGAAALLNAKLSLAELGRLENDIFRELASVSLYDDSLAALEKIKNAGLKIGLCSNLAAPYAVPAHLLLPRVDAYAWSFEVGAIKPEVAIYKHISKKLNCSPSSIVMIGDTYEADVIGPSNADLKGYHLQRSACTINGVFSSLLDFADFIIRENDK